ncbi:MAG: helix-turn-helix domain-containing protein [Coriobacteriales bacterium]
MSSSNSERSSGGQSPDAALRSNRAPAPWNIQRRRAFGIALSTARLDRGLSLRELAWRIGSAPSYLFKIEHGLTSTGFDMACRLADELDVPLKDLIDF